MIGFLFGVLELVMLPFDLIALLVDIACWFKGKPNRQARKAAKRAGEDPPARNGWSKAFVVCSILVAAATFYLFILWFLRI